MRLFVRLQYINTYNPPVVIKSLLNKLYAHFVLQNKMSSQFYVSKILSITVDCKVQGTALQTRLDLYNSELSLASSPVLFWNLCVQTEIWISIVICGLAAVVGQASKAPLSLLMWQLPAAQELHQHLSTPPLPMSPLFTI